MFGNYLRYLVEKGAERKSTPCIPQGVYEQLPGLLNKACSVFDNQRERDVFLTGALTVLSACLPEVRGIYDRRIYHPHLFSFVIAPAASGKGAMNFAKTLGMAIHQELLLSSKKAEQRYKQERYQYEVAAFQHKKGTGGAPPPPPETPAFQLLYIPANSSSAMLIQHLQKNNGTGILFESESDTLGNVLKQDWGGYSDLLRKAFHHEAISYSRKQGNEFVEIQGPQLSVALSGTPKQVGKLIPSTEDGLFSRFLFYVFEGEVSWRDVSPEGSGTDWTGMFAALSKKVLQMAKFLKEHRTTVALKREQWKDLNAFFRRQLAATHARMGSAALSIVKRMGLIAFRMMMVFTALRKFEKQQEDKQCYCSDQDFETALQLAGYYLQHALFQYEQMRAKQVSDSRLLKRKERFWKALPSRFRRKEAIEIGGALGMSSASVDRCLKLWLGELLGQPKYGVYCK